MRKDGDSNGFEQSGVAFTESWECIELVHEKDTEENNKIFSIHQKDNSMSP